MQDRGSGHNWKRRFVAYVETRVDNEKCVELRVKIPRAMADAIDRECSKTGAHVMVYYCDAFACGLSDALTKIDNREALVANGIEDDRAEDL